MCPGKVGCDSKGQSKAQHCTGGRPWKAPPYGTTSHFNLLLFKYTRCAGVGRGRSTDRQPPAPAPAQACRQPWQATHERTHARCARVAARAYAHASQRAASATSCPANARIATPRHARGQLAGSSQHKPLRSPHTDAGGAGVAGGGNGGPSGPARQPWSLSPTPHPPPRPIPPHDAAAAASAAAAAAQPRRGTARHDACLAPLAACGQPASEPGSEPGRQAGRQAASARGARCRGRPTARARCRGRPTGRRPYPLLPACLPALTSKQPHQPITARGQRKPAYVRLPSCCTAVLLYYANTCRCRCSAALPWAPALQRSGSAVRLSSAPLTRPLHLFVTPGPPAWLLPSPILPCDP